MTSIMMEEYELQSDSRYRSYTTSIDKALKSFEYTSEWADLISALGKLNKVLLNNTKFPVIPKRITISKRLAQCMHPALPSGVHLKALETYDIIFRCIGTNRLSQELFIYSAGLFPLLAHAAMNVKPKLLTIYETHFVPLGERLRPGLNGFLTGVLPGLEEGSDYYERIDKLLLKVCDEVDKSFFYGCLWRCIMSNPSIRLPAICFIISHFNKKLTMEDQLHVIGTDIDTMVYAICASLQDSSVLVQRCALDLLLLGFPVCNSQLVPSDIAKIVTSAITVVLRRDMSLNRRLFGWLLGNDVTCNNSPSSEQITAQDSIDESEVSSHNSYFEMYSKEYLLQALRMCFDKPENHLNMPGSMSVPPVLWSYRLLISLLDRPEISSAILDEILVEVFRSLYKESDKCSNQSNSRSSKDSKGNSELIKTANLLFGTFEPYYIWDYLAKTFHLTCTKSRAQRSKDMDPNRIEFLPRRVQLIGAGMPTVHEVCILIDYLLNIVSLETYPETRTEYLPKLLTKVSDALAEHCDVLAPSELSSSLQLCSKLLSKVQPAVISVTSNSEDAGATELTYNPNELSGVPYDHNCANPCDVENAQNASGDLSCTEGTASKRIELVFSPSEIISEMLLASEYLTLESHQHNENQNVSLNATVPATAISNCVESIQYLFVKFVKLLVYDNYDNFLYCFNKLMEPKQDINNQREQKLNTLLHKCLGTISNETIEENSTKQSDSNEESSQEMLDSVELTVKSSALEVTDAFCNLCHLFVELSSFPTYCTTSKQLVDMKPKHGECDSLPEWLKILLVVACFVNIDDFHFSAMTTVVELIALTQSIRTSPESSPVTPVSASPASVPPSSPSVVSVVIIPMVDAAQLEYIWEKTKFFSIAATKLWKYLDESLPKYHLHSVELLQQVHNLAKHSNICEKVICNSMASNNELEQVSAQKKFCVLWHMTRDLRLKSTPSRMMRAFDRCLFLMLESLGKETGPQKAVAQCWLNHSLQRGDVARILEPILLILLHPDSARVSVQHVSVHCPKIKTEDEEEQQDTKEAKIYAISSVSGNIIYHVSDDSRPSSQQGSPEKKIFALTSIINAGSNKESKVVTSNSNIHEFELPSSHEREISQPISLFINPFGSLMSLNSDVANDTPRLPDLTNVTRLGGSNWVKNSFDDSEVESKPVVKEMTSAEIVASILDEIISNVVSEGKADKDNMYCFSSGYGLDEIFEEIDHMPFQKISNEVGEENVNSSENQDYQLLTVHPIHSYILLYCQVYDSHKTMYALSSLKAVILTNPRVALCNMATTNISSSLSSRGQELQVLLARHRKSVFGNNFHGEISAESITVYRSSTFVEVIVSACLYYIRGYYPNLPQVRLTEEEVVGNRNVRLLCTEVLTLVFSELVGIVKDSGKSFASYLNDLLMRCKVQKILLHCLVASVYNLQLTQAEYSERQPTFTETIIEFSERPSRSDQDKEKKDDFQDTFQVHLLRLVATLIVLEDTIISQCTAENEGRNGLGIKLEGTERTSRKFSSHMSCAKYHPGVHIPSQPMLLTAIISALRQTHKTHLHTYWLSLVTSALPFASCSLTQLVISVVSQLCHNLENVASVYCCNSDSIGDKSKELFQTPPDYLLTIIEGLTTLCHYCLLDSPAPVSTPISQPPLPPAPSQPYAPGANASQIISNLLHVFSTSNGQKYVTASQEHSNSMETVLATRRVLLSNMPCILSSVASIWQALITMEEEMPDLPQPSWIMGSPKAVKQHILSFLSPISLNYGPNFMAAVAVVWYDCRPKGSSTNRKVLLPWSNEQLLLVQLVGAIKVLPMETVVQNVRQVLRQPPPSTYDKNKNQKKVPLEVNILQFFLAYVQNTSGSQLLESRQSLLGLWKDGLQLASSPPVQFHLLAILHEFVQKTLIIEDKKDQKDLQDVAQKLIESCSTVAGACLEQTTWLWRNLAVRPGPQHDIPDSDQDVEATEEEDDANNCKIQAGEKDDAVNSVATNGSSNSQYYSVQALCVLAEFLAPVLDVVYASEEKEKVVPLLNSIMHYVTPYLRNHDPHNIPSFRACSQLLASVCTYQYTRKAWRKDAFDLLLDPSFFQIDSASIGYWQAIIDHLMTHDKTTFRDFMTRVAMAQSGSLNLFSSKEQEYEQRVQLLKRLAFVLFCSEVDQYQRFMPDIQERLSESLRLPQVPSIQAQVFLCFRVLLICMSPHHVTSLWPVIITEMVQVFLQIEHELCTDTEEFSSHLRRLCTLDSTWVVANNNGLDAHNNPAWLHLYLSACKLLDMAVALPSDMLPQFQMYRWAFVGDSPSLLSDIGKKKAAFTPDFTPHIVRIATMLNRRTASKERLNFIPGQPLLTMTSIKSLHQLQPFFNTMADITSQQQPIEDMAQHSKLHKSKSTSEFNNLFIPTVAIDNNRTKTTLQCIKRILELDFLEPRSSPS